MADDNRSPDTTAKLRDDIDNGRSGDKIGFPDPAAAPLGTDAEAGGASPTPEQVRMAQRHEVDGRPEGPTAASDPRPVTMQHPTTDKPGVRSAAWILAPVLAVCALLYFVLS